MLRVDTIEGVNSGGNPTDLSARLGLSISRREAHLRTDY